MLVYQDNEMVNCSPLYTAETSFPAGYSGVTKITFIFRSIAISGKEPERVPIVSSFPDSS